MEKSLLKYYKLKYYGKSTFARTLDFVVIRFSLFCALFFALMFSIKKLWLSLLLSALVIIAGSIALYTFRQKRLSRFIEQQLKDLSLSLQVEQLVLMPTKAYFNLIMAVLEKHGFQKVSQEEGFFYATMGGEDYLIAADYCHPVDKTSISLVLSYIRFAMDNSITHLCIVSPSGFSDEAKDLINRAQNIHIQLIDREKFLELAEETGFKTSEEDAKNAAKEQMLKSVVRINALKSAIIAKKKAKAYMLCGILCITWMVISGFTPLNLVLGLVCFILALVSYREKAQS